jgi:flagellar biosynthesis protein FliQ
MSPEVVAELYRNALTVTLLLGGPILGVTLVVGTVISVLQAATQINEMTLTFIPKALAAGGTMWLLSGWLLDQWLAYTREVYLLIENVATTF